MIKVLINSHGGGQPRGGWAVEKNLQSFEVMYAWYTSQKYICKGRRSGSCLLYQNWWPNPWERKKVDLEKTKLCKRKNSLHNQYLLRFHGSPVLPKRRNTIQETTTFTTSKSGIRFSSYSFLDSTLLQQQLSMLSLLIWSKRGYWPKIR